MNSVFQQFSHDTVRAAAERPREDIDVASMTPAQQREVWPDLKKFLVDPCSAILLQSLENAHFDPHVMRDRNARIHARREAAQAARQEKPR